MRLKLERPIMFFDLETTGTNILRDRIVEISMIKVYPDGHDLQRTVRVNPGMPIPAEATAVHHITDADVADKPLFADIAAQLAESFAGCDIAGFNSNRFDVPMLAEEFARVGVDFDFTAPRYVDVQTISTRRSSARSRLHTASTATKTWRAPTRLMPTPAPPTKCFWRSLSATPTSPATSTDYQISRCSRRM